MKKVKPNLWYRHRAKILVHLQNVDYTFLNSIFLGFHKI